MFTFSSKKLVLSAFVATAALAFIYVPTTIPTGASDHIDSPIITQRRTEVRI